MSGLRIRRYEEADLEDLVRMWHETKREAYPYLPTEQAHTLADDREFFRNHIRRRCEVWLALEGSAIQGFLAIEGGYIDRLYVRVGAQRRGVGSALLARAREISPAGLRLHTHVRNEAGRAFYERHGFRVVRFGVSPPPESEPDVEYHWAPDF